MWKVAVLIAGIGCLAAGVVVQDVLVSDEAVDMAYYFLRTSSPPLFSEIQEYLEEELEPAIMQGIFLKLSGVGLLCVLYFTAVRRIAAGDRAKAWLLSALGVGWVGCFAVFAVMAPLASYFRWSFQVLTSYVPGYLVAGEAHKLQEAMIAQGAAAATGVLVLAVSLLLLGAAFLLLTRRRISSVSLGAPALFALAMALDSERRVITPEPSVVELLQRVYLIDIAAMVVAVLLSVAGVLSLVLGGRRPRLSVRIAGYAVLFLGGFMVVAWVSIASVITELRPALRIGEAHVHLADIGHPIERGWMANYFLSWLLLVACVVLPLVCAVAMRRMSLDKKPASGKSSKAPLWAMFVALALIVGAGVCCAWEDPYHNSLEKVVGAFYDEDGMESVKEHVERMDSDEGLAFLQRSMYDHDQFFMHPFIMRHLWERSRHTRAKQAVLDMLYDAEHPIAALHARDKVVDSISSDNLCDYYHLRREENRASTLELLTPILLKEPGYGAKVLRVAIESNNANGGFLFDIMKVCARAGVTSFRLPQWSYCEDDEYSDEYCLVIPEGFTIHYNRKHAGGKKAVRIRLCMCKRGDLGLTPHPFGDVPAAFVGDRPLAYIVDKMGQRRPDYSELIERLRAAKAATEGKAVVPSLVIDSKIWSYYVMHLLNACAAAGVTEVNFVES